MENKKKKHYYCIKGDWKELTKEEFAKEFAKAYPLRTKVMTFTSRLLVLVTKTAMLFLFVTAIYSVFKWAIGVWV